jgi:hypothetical protein
MLSTTVAFPPQLFAKRPDRAIRPGVASASCYATRKPTELSGLFGGKSRNRPVAFDDRRNGEFVMKRALALGAAAAAMIAAPLAAADRMSAPVESESEIGGANRGLLLVGVAAALVTVILVANEDNDDEAVSP